MYNSRWIHLICVYFIYAVHGARDDNTLSIKRIGSELNALDRDGDYEDIGGPIDDFELAPMKSAKLEASFVDNPVYGSAEAAAQHYSVICK